MNEWMNKICSIDNITQNVLITESNRMPMLVVCWVGGEEERRINKQNCWKKWIHNLAKLQLKFFIWNITSKCVGRYQKLLIKQKWNGKEMMKKRCSFFPTIECNNTIWKGCLIYFLMRTKETHLLISYHL